MEVQFLKPMNALKTFESSSVRMTDRNISVLRYPKRTLHMKVQHTCSTNYNAPTII